MPEPKHKLGRRAATVLAVAVMSSTILIGDLLAGQPRLLRLGICLLAAVAIAAAGFLISRRMAGKP